MRRTVVIVSFKFCFNMVLGWCLGGGVGVYEGFGTLALRVMVLLEGENYYGRDD